MADQPTTRDQLIEQALVVLDRHMGGYHATKQRQRAAVEALVDAGLLADPGQHAELERIEDALAEFQVHDADGPVPNVPLSERIEVLHREWEDVTVERDALQARIATALERIAEATSTGPYCLSPDETRTVRTALQGDQPTEPEVEGITLPDGTHPPRRMIADSRCRHGRFPLYCPECPGLGKPGPHDDDVLPLADRARMWVEGQSAEPNCCDWPDDHAGKPCPERDQPSGELLAIDPIDEPTGEADRG